MSATALGCFHYICAAQAFIWRLWRDRVIAVIPCIPHLCIWYSYISQMHPVNHHQIYCLSFTIISLFAWTVTLWLFCLTNNVTTLRMNYKSESDWLTTSYISVYLSTVQIAYSRRMCTYTTNSVFLSSTFCQNFSIIVKKIYIVSQFQMHVHQVHFQFASLSQTDTASV